MRISQWRISWRGIAVKSINPKFFVAFVRLGRRHYLAVEALEKIQYTNLAPNVSRTINSEKTRPSFALYTYAIMRIIVGLLFVSHGRQKISGWFGGQAVPLGSLFGVAGIIEIVLGLLIVIGLFAGYAAFIASGEMAVAYFIGHFQKSFWPLENQGEPAVLFCFMFFVYGDSGRGDLECRCSTRSGRDPNSRKEAYVEAAAMWRNSKARNLNSTSQLKNSKLLNVMIPAVCIGYSNFEIACNFDI